MFQGGGGLGLDNSFSALVRLLGNVNWSSQCKAETVNPGDGDCGSIVERARPVGTWQTMRGEEEGGNRGCLGAWVENWQSG